MPLITELFAFISEDEPGDEGIIGMNMPDGTWYPFIGANMDRVVSLKPFADKIAAISGKPYKIAKFEMKEVVYHNASRSSKD